jgi:serine/threonine protein kinase
VPRPPSARVPTASSPTQLVATRGQPGAGADGREFAAGYRSPTAGLTEDGALIGTPHYMAPELWRAEPATRRSDVYALGVLLYHPVRRSFAERGARRFAARA